MRSATSGVNAMVSPVEPVKARHALPAAATSGTASRTSASPTRPSGPPAQASNAALSLALRCTAPSFSVHGKIVPSASHAQKKTQQASHDTSSTTELVKFVTQAPDAVCVRNGLGCLQVMPRSASCAMLAARSAGSRASPWTSGGCASAGRSALLAAAHSSRLVLPTFTQAKLANALCCSGQDSGRPKVSLNNA
jgi:hypothetical protein